MPAKLSWERKEEEIEKEFMNRYYLAHFCHSRNEFRAGSELVFRHPELVFCHPELVFRHPELVSGSSDF